MNIGQLIEHPQQDLGPHLQDLEKLVSKSNYSSTLMMLYLKALKDTNSVDFEDQLKKTAILCQDRSVLFDFIKNTPGKSSLDVVSTIEETATQNEVLDDTKDQHDTIIDNYEEVETDDIAIEEEQIIIEKETTPEDAPKKEEAEDQDAPIFELNKDIYARAVHASIHNEEEDKEEERDAATDEEHEKRTPEDEEIEVETPQESSKEKLSFIEWLQAQQKNRTATEVSETTSQKITPKETAPEKEDDNVHRSEINAIVDKFIKEEPTITRKKTEFFSPSETAKKSIEENDTIVTETLAEIYLSQGNYKKAIAAYEKLILKFPKKKSFFADRIEFIKKKRQ